MKLRGRIQDTLCSSLLANEPNRAPRICFGPVFNFKLGSLNVTCMAYTKTLLEVKTQPRAQCYKTFYIRNLRIF